MKIKTSELTGPALDFAVAKIEGIKLTQRIDSFKVYGACVLQKGGIYSPSSSWERGGPIIERERIEVRPREKSEGWFASIHNIWMFMPGSTALIAAMRCYVVSKLGDEVDIPEELV